MFGKKKQETKEASEKQQPKEVKEMPIEAGEDLDTSEGTNAKEVEEPTEETTESQDDNVDFTKEQLAQVIEKLASDIAAIKHHLRLDFF